MIGIGRKIFGRSVCLKHTALLFVAACLTAGVYGALHNQISYTVSPEYFTKFKFIQFNIPESSHNRIGASIVGWLASWWMGLLLGAILIPMGHVLSKSSGYLRAMMRVYGVVAVTAMATGLLALAISLVAVSPDSVREIIVYHNVIADPVAFMRAGTMHNFSYLGGLLGVVTGGVSIFRQKRAFAKTPAV